MVAYLVARMLALERMVDETSVDDRNERVALDIACKLEVSMRLLNVPFFLKFGGGLPVV